MSGEEYVRSAVQVVGRAVGFDREENYQVAIYFYNEAVHLLQRAIEEEPDKEQWRVKAQEYSNRIQVLQEGLLTLFFKTNIVISDNDYCTRPYMMDGYT
jgi:formaldehyde-activating enzyme involved in methanogenesis